MRVKTRGGLGACSATALTRRPVRFWRFFLRIETTSTLVQLQRAIRSASMGLGPWVCAESASKRMVLPFSAMPSNVLPCCHSLWAIISLHSPPLLPRVIRHRFGMDGDPVDAGEVEFEAVFERRDSLVDALHG